MRSVARVRVVAVSVIVASVATAIPLADALGREGRWNTRERDGVRTTVGASRGAPPGTPNLRVARGAHSVPPSFVPSQRSMDRRSAIDQSSFDAISRVGANWPGDPTGAVSDTWYLTAANAFYALYDRSGSRVLGPRPLGDLFALPPDTTSSGPRVVYDPYADTFVLGFLALASDRSRSWILLTAIPEGTADETSSWCGTKVRVDRTRGDGRQWTDYLGLGFTADRVTVTTNQFALSEGSFAFAQIMSFDKSTLYDCSRPVEFDTFVGDRTRNPDGSPAFALVPAVSAGAEPGAQYLVSLDPGRPAQVVVWRLRQTEGEVVLSRSGIAIRGSVSIGPWATQCGGTVDESNSWWDPGDLRFVSAFFDADRNRLYASHVIARDLDPDPVTGDYLEAVVRWYEIRPEAVLGRSAIVRRGIVGSPESDAGWPAVATSADGDLLVVYSRASAPLDECLSAYVARIPLDGATAAMEVLASGEARFEARKGPERWGRWAAAARDPLDASRVVLIGQYAVGDGGRTTWDWRQVVHLVIPS